MPITSAWEANTPEKFAEIPEIVKAGILECLNGELVPLTVTPGEKIPAVKNRRIVDLDTGTWATRLKSDRHLEGTGDNTTRKVHCYLVGFGGIVAATDDNTVGGKSFQLRFLIDSYYEDEIGTDLDNPEKRHGEEISRITHVLWMSRTLKRPKFVKKIVDWSERRGFAKMGNNIMRESLAELIVDLHAVPMVTPTP
jgi:hypothetical protein